MPPNVIKANNLVYENDETDRLSYFHHKGYRQSPILFVNGRRVPDKLTDQARPNQTLLSFLRDVMHLTGTKLGCAEGGCGACTVMISKKMKGSSEVKHFSVNACLMPVLSADGCHVTTVEGVGTVKGNNLHPVQKAMVDMHGSQCGFCTPGIIMSIYTLLANHASVPYLEEHLDGNLCRCTGYRPIWDAARSLCDDGEELVTEGSCGNKCADCPSKKNGSCKSSASPSSPSSDICQSSSADKMKTYKETVLANESWKEQPNSMFPTELLNEKSLENQELDKPLVVIDKTEFNASGMWIKPSSFTDLLAVLNDIGGLGLGKAKIVVGNTEVGIETRFKHSVYPVLVNPSESIEELFGLEFKEDRLVLGSCCPLSKIQETCGTVGKENRDLSRTLLPIHDMLRWFASTQIRNVACLGGNLVTASPISDMNPLLAAMGAKLILTSASDGGVLSRRCLNVSDFFVKYRTVDLSPTEVVERVEIPFLAKVFDYVKAFKQARRREDDISIVTSGMRIKLKVEGGKFVIVAVALAFGGMAPTTIMALNTSKSMIGCEFCEATFRNAKELLLQELLLPETVPGGQASYRMTLAASFLHKFFLQVAEEVTHDIEQIEENPLLFAGNLPAVPVIDSREGSVVHGFLSEAKPRFYGVQKFPNPKVASGLEDKILPRKGDANTIQVGELGKAATHMSGALHCTGEAVYTDDVPLPPGTLQGCLVLADRCGVVFESMDTKSALAIPGVVSIVTCKDIEELGGHNEIGPVIHDEKVFLQPGDMVATVGQVLGICVAESLELAEAGARATKIAYKETSEKIIVSVEDAISANSFFEMCRHKIIRGNVQAIDELHAPGTDTNEPKPGDIVKVSGTFHSGAQEHFYLEPNSTLVVPGDADTTLTIYSSTQAPTKTQMCCADVTGTQASKVAVHVKRLGGGFGGKETRSVFASCACAVAAKRLCRPVRLTLGRDTDMKLTGTRHVFVSYYSASAVITEVGARLLSLDAKIYANGGYALDLSGPVVDRALFHLDGCYYWPNFRAEGVPCKTCQAPHTAFRGFGGPQGMAVAEHIMDHLATACKVPGDLLRRMNIYNNGQSLPYGMKIDGPGTWNVPMMWDRLMVDANVSERREAIRIFNSTSRWKKRGLAVIPTKFGIAFTAKFMNQGSALVHLYTDGTVLVSHGGTEMGQGLHTKVCQVAAQAFGIPVENVYINDTSTDKVANSIATAASMSTDTYGMATLDACRQILTRLEPIRKDLGPNASLREVATKAFFERIDLSARGFFALDNSRCGFVWDGEKPEGTPVDEPENAWRGHPFNYFTQGVACAEVEVDFLTGDHRTVRADIIVDVGSSINPAIDIGQIEGAFVQGMGWSTIEEVIHADSDHVWIKPRGSVFTTGPGTYKIPAFNDVPEIFNVSLLEDVDNPWAVHSSKAIGEPPFFLGTSVFYAIKDAVIAARQENTGSDAYFEMKMPASSERIRMYAADSLAQKAIQTMRNDDSSVLSFQPQGSY